MRTLARSRRIPPSRLLSQLEVVPTKVHVTQPIEMRLEEMVIELMSRARDLGRITRGEVVGTLILGRDADDELVDELRRYRDAATAGDALPGRNAIMLRPPVRGRPRRRV